MADGSDIQVAHGAPAQVNVGTKVDVFVRVRDLCGRPLKDARVVLGASRGIATTGEDGLATFAGMTGITSIDVVVQYVPNFGKYRTAGQTVKKTLTIAEAFDPTPPGTTAPPSRLELHATISVPVYYPLTRLFSWQNPYLRAKIYMDGISVGEFRKVHDVDHPEKDRVMTLREIVAWYDPDYSKLVDAEKAAAAKLKDFQAKQAKLGKDVATQKKDQDLYDK